MISTGDVVEFAGYQDLNGAEEILKKGQKVKVIEIVPTEKGNWYNVYPVKEDGEIDENGDQVSGEEIVPLIDEGTGDVLEDLGFSEEEKEEIRAEALNKLQELGQKYDVDIEVDSFEVENAKNDTTSNANDGTEEDNLADIDDTELEHDPAVEELIRGTNDLADLAYSLYAAHEESYYKLGGILIDIKRNKMHVEAGYEDTNKGFIDYVQDFIGPRQRSIYYIMSIYRELREINLTSQDLKGIGWTKARLLKDVKGADKKLEFMNKAKDLSRQELEDWINEREEREPNKKVRFSFSVLPEAAEVINQALESVSFEAENNKNKGFELICAHYLATTE